MARNTKRKSVDEMSSPKEKLAKGMQTALGPTKATATAEDNTDALRKEALALVAKLRKVREDITNLEDDQTGLKESADCFKDVIMGTVDHEQMARSIFEEVKVVK